MNNPSSNARVAALRKMMQSTLGAPQPEQRTRSWTTEPSKQRSQYTEYPPRNNVPPQPQGDMQRQQTRQMVHQPVVTKIGPWNTDSPQRPPRGAPQDQSPVHDMPRASPCNDVSTGAMSAPTARPPYSPFPTQVTSAMVAPVSQRSNSAMPQAMMSPRAQSAASLGQAGMPSTYSTSSPEQSSGAWLARSPTHPGRRRLYRVTATGLGVRVAPDVKAARTGAVLLRGKVFEASVVAPGVDNRIYLKLAGARGWVFDDSAVDPTNPSVEPMSEEEAYFHNMTVASSRDRSVVGSDHLSARDRNVMSLSQDFQVRDRNVVPISQDMLPVRERAVLPISTNFLSRDHDMLMNPDSQSARDRGLNLAQDFHSARDLGGVLPLSQDFPGRDRGLPLSQDFSARDRGSLAMGPEMPSARDRGLPLGVEFPSTSPRASSLGYPVRADSSQHDISPRSSRVPASNYRPEVRAVSATRQPCGPQAVVPCHGPSSVQRLSPEFIPSSVPSGTPSGLGGLMPPGPIPSGLGGLTPRGEGPPELSEAFRMAMGGRSSPPVPRRQPVS